MRPEGPPPEASPRARAAGGDGGGGDGSTAPPAAQRPITRWMRKIDERTGSMLLSNVDTGELRTALPPSGVLVGAGAVV